MLTIAVEVALVTASISEDLLALPVPQTLAILPLVICSIGPGVLSSPVLLVAPPFSLVPFGKVQTGLKLSGR